MSRGQSLGHFPCNMGVGGDLQTLALQPHTVMVRKRIAPLPAVAKLYVTVADHAVFNLTVYVMGTMHRIMSIEYVWEARFPWSLNFSKFVVGRSWCLCAAVDLDEEALFSQD